jgi:hypothetical protein
MTTDEITGRVIEAKGFDAADAALHKAIGEQSLALVRSKARFGLDIGKGPQRDRGSK